MLWQGRGHNVSGFCSVSSLGRALLGGVSACSQLNEEPVAEGQSHGLEKKMRDSLCRPVWDAFAFGKCKIDYCSMLPATCFDILLIAPGTLSALLLI